MTTNIFNIPRAKEFAAQKDAQMAKAQNLSRRIIDFIHLGCFSNSFPVNKEETALFQRFDMERDLLASGYKTIACLGTEADQLHFGLIYGGEFKRLTGLFANLLTADQLLVDIHDREVVIAERIKKALEDAIDKTKVVKVGLFNDEYFLAKNGEIRCCLDEGGYKSYFGVSSADEFYLEISLPE